MALISSGKPAATSIFDSAHAPPRRLADRRQVPANPRAPARQHQSAQGTHHIGQVFELLAEIFARRAFIDKNRTA